MTNGEKLCIDFPDMKYTITGNRVVTTIGVAASFDLDWWNSEYKEPIKALEQEPVYYPPCIDCNKKMDEIRKAYDNMTTKAPEQEPFINKPCVSSGVCEHDKNKVLDKIRAEIKGKIEQEEFARSVFRHEEKDAVKAEQCTGSIMAYNNVIKFIDKYKVESEETKW